MKKKIIFIFISILIITILGHKNQIIEFKKKYFDIEDEKTYCSNLLAINIPKDSSILNSKNTHSGFHGDGVYYVVFQLNKNNINKFYSNAIKNNWSKTPINPNLKSFLFGFTVKNSNSIYAKDGLVKNIPDNIKNGIYYFKDNYNKENNKENLTIENRSSNNFIFSILDLNSYKLYIYEYDS